LRGATAPASCALSVIIPVYNGGDSFRDCLASVFASSIQDFEVIVVDDGSTDGSVRVAGSFPCRVLQLAENSGPAKARNLAAEASRGRILFFLDADILIRRDSLDLILRTFEDEPAIDALFGSYTKETIARNFVSVYKNLMHHYTHQTANPDAVTFCGGFGAIRRNVFFQLEGFNPAIRFLEDIEFGHRLHLNGRRIRLLKSLQLTHCKHYTLLSLIRSDVWGRAVPWSRLILETGVVKSDLNLRPHNVASVAVSYLLLLSLLLLPVFPLAGLWPAAALASLFVALNQGFLGFVARTRRAGFALASVAMLWFGYIYSGAGAILGVLAYLSARRLSAVAASAAAVVPGPLNRS
jgi:glycosyltransferase involved in cell wall biosynthesis